MQKAEQTRQRILDAALETIRTLGYQGLTLEAVAKQASLSKGGLLHHFPSKDVLVEAILEALIHDFEQVAESYYQSDSQAKGRWLRAYIRASFASIPPVNELTMLLLSALIEKPELAQIVKADTAKWQTRFFNEGLREARVRLLWQSVDAYWVNQLFTEEKLSEEAVQALLDELLALTEGL